MFLFHPVNIHINKKFRSRIIYFYSYIIFNLFKKIIRFYFIVIIIIIKSVLISAIFLELYIYIYIYIHFPHVNIYNPTINKSTKKYIYIFPENMASLDVTYNAGQKLLRQTRKTASYLTPQVMNNQFK